MEIIIPLPQIDSSANTYKELNSYLKQLELAIHHAQKSIESAERDGVEISEDAYIIFEHPLLESSVKADGIKENDEGLKNFIDNYFDELQYVELKINLS